jgi:hypothetical protein
MAVTISTTIERGWRRESHARWPGPCQIIFVKKKMSLEIFLKQSMKILRKLKKRTSLEYILIKTKPSGEISLKKEA